MNTERKQDYILRMIQRAAAVVRRTLGLKENEQIAEAILEVDLGISELLGHQAELIPIVDAVTATRLLNDPNLVCSYANLLAIKSDLLVDQPTRARALKSRSDALYQASRMMRNEHASLTEPKHSSSYFSL